MSAIRRHPPPASAHRDVTNGVTVQAATPLGPWLGACAGALLTLTVTIGCAASDPSVSTDSGASGDTSASIQTSVSEAATEQPWFTDHAEQSGLSFVHFNGMSGEFYFPEIMAPGVGLLDVDNDGDLDAFLVQGRTLGRKTTSDRSQQHPADPSGGGGRLYRNDLTVNNDGTRVMSFVDVTRESGIRPAGYGMGVATGDIDNDGWVDIYVTNVGRNQMFRNQGDGTFVDVAQPSGLDDSGWGVSAAFLDYDRDGWLDLYLGNYVSYSVETDKECSSVTGSRGYCLPHVYRALPDRLYRNEGDGNFVDVTAAALTGSDFGRALGVSTADFDGDGWIDIYVANDGEENQLWLNQRNGTFKNTALLAGVALSAHGRAEASMGVDAGDADNDGDEDLFIANLTGEGGTLYTNNGSGLFDDWGTRSGVRPASLGHTGFGTAWFDYDNDGWLDILIVNGAIQARGGRPGHPFPYDQRKLLFRNLRNGRFEDISAGAGPAFQVSEVGRGAAFGDIDNDGDVDVLVANANGPTQLLVNNVGHTAHWVGLRLVGEHTGRDMLGARVGIARHDGSMIWRRARADGSYASANDPRVVIGLGDFPEVQHVVVQWPSGRTEEWHDLAIDRWTVLTEGSGS